MFETWSQNWNEVKTESSLEYDVLIRTIAHTLRGFNRCRYERRISHSYMQDDETFKYVAFVDRLNILWK